MVIFIIKQYHYYFKPPKAKVERERRCLTLEHHSDTTPRYKGLYTVGMRKNIVAYTAHRLETGQLTVR